MTNEVVCACLSALGFDDIQGAEQNRLEVFSRLDLPGRRLNEAAQGCDDSRGNLRRGV